MLSGLEPLLGIPVHALCGNHDQHLIEFLLAERPDPAALAAWAGNGGLTTLAELGVRRLLFAIHGASFPADPGEDLGVGAPSTRAARRLLELIRTLQQKVVSLQQEDHRDTRDYESRLRVFAETTVTDIFKDPSGAVAGALAYYRETGEFLLLRAPAVVLAMQLLMGALFGILGVLFADTILATLKVVLLDLSRKHEAVEGERPEVVSSA